MWVVAEKSGYRSMKTVLLYDRAIQIDKKGGTNLINYKCLKIT